jgi:3-deoxy-D-manno-octulosonic-acid transferase
VLLVLVPRHPDRFDEVAKLVKRAGLKMQKRSKGVPVMADTRVWLGDSMGEMYAYYGAADVAIIGGSWARLGGQNPIEASAVGCPVIVGPHTFNFKAVCEQAIEVGAAVRADDIDDGLQVALEIIADPIRRKAMSEAGSLFAHSHRGATGRTMDLLTPCCAPPGHAGPASAEAARPSAAGNPAPSRRRSPRPPSCCAGRP